MATQSIAIHTYLKARAHSQCFNISVPYFTSLIIHCTKHFLKFIFAALSDYENILTTKIPKFMGDVLLILQ